MYHINNKNQVFNLEKSLLNTHLSAKHSQTDHNIVTYTPFQQQLLSVFRQYQCASWIKLSNAKLASLIGSSIKTVTRATNKFHRDGLIIKHQQHQYDTNHYTLNDKFKKGKYAFSHWVNSLSSNNQELYNSHGIRIDHKNKIIYSYENVPPNSNSLILDNLFINLSPSSRMRERDLRIFKKINGKKTGEVMNRFPAKQFVIAKPKEKPIPKRNTGGHSPIVLKPVLPFYVQIIQLENDIKSLLNKIELNKGPSYMISYAMNLVEHKTKELLELKEQHANTTIHH